MHASSLALACFVVAGCNQILGIDPVPLDDVPAISGGYVVGVDLRTNTALNEVVLFNTTVTYARDDLRADIVMQPALPDRTDVGDAWVFTVDLNLAEMPMYSGDSITGEVPTEASPNGRRYAVDGTVAGVFKSESTFCGVITGSYTLSGTTLPLPSVTFGAIKYPEASSPVSVNCNGDLYTP